jgi:hypothetical protein
VGEVVQWPGPAGDGEPPVAEVDVVDLQLAYCLGPRGVDGGQREDQPVQRPLGGADGVVNVVAV